MNTRLKLIAVFHLLLVICLSAFAQGTAFTYQGRLNDGANPANGIYDLRFAIYDSTNSPGTLIAGPLTNSATAVTNGLFTVTLDFGALVFNGADRWLEIAVRTNGGGTFSTLNARQQLTPAPYAISAANLAGVVANDTVDAAFATVAGGSNNVIQAGSTASAIGGGLNNLIQTGSQEATIAGGVGNRIETNAVCSTIGGGFNNVASGNTATIGGGAYIASSGDFATVGGGYRNASSGLYATVGGGAGNFSRGASATVAGGNINIASGNAATVGGGYSDFVDAAAATVAGGSNNVIHVNSTGAAIGGGLNNLIQTASGDATIAGGGSNIIQTNAYSATIGGGGGNTIQASASYSTIGGGGDNTVSGLSAIIGGGAYNVSTGDYSTTGGGSFNTNSGYASTVPGGYANAAAGDYSFAAGERAKANHKGSFVWADAQNADFASTSSNQFLIRASGGVGIGITAPEAPLHVADGSAGTVTANANSIAVLEKSGNGYLSLLTPAANESGIIFGNPSASTEGAIIFNNAAASHGLEFRTGTNATQMTILANGNVGVGTTIPSREFEVQNSSDTEIGIKSTDTGGHLWTLQSSGVTGSANLDASFQIIDRTLNTSRLLIGTNGNVGIGTNAPNQKLVVAGNIFATGTITPNSDRNVKTGFAPVDATAILDKVSQLPLQQWRFKTEAEGVKHLGPMAQDFRAAFGLGEIPTAIATVDADGVALAAIQGLNEKVEIGKRNAETRIEKLEAENAALKQRLDALEKIIRNQKSN